MSFMFDKDNNVLDEYKKFKEITQTYYWNYGSLTIAVIFWLLIVFRYTKHGPFYKTPYFRYFLVFMLTMSFNNVLVSVAFKVNDFKFCLVPAIIAIGYIILMYFHSEFFIR